MPEEKPRVPYWHVYVDKDGTSRQTRCHLEDFDLKSISPPATPQWLGQKTTARSTVSVIVLPVGWTGDWHENPKPQWIIPISGRWYVETMDGQRVEMGPGDLSFGEDQGTRDKRGHASGTVGDKPAVMMLVQFETGFGPATPCRFA